MVGIMKPILFPSDATTFTTNGLGSLDPTSCVVTEERNGQYELECVVPTESAHFADIHNNMILVVIPGDGMTVHAASQRQAFRIYHITEPLNGLVTINARHISYDLSYNTVMPFTATSIQTAFSGIVANMVETNLFSFNTDKTTTANFNVSVPQTARQLLGGQQGSILDVYGGEYQWDNWTVNLWGQRGTDSNVTLRYGKNITDISQEENLENVVTGIVPFWANEDSVVTLPEKSVDSAYASSYPYKRTVPVDFSSDWEDAPTESQLRNRAQSYITANKIGVPKVSIKVSFVALWQTDEYKSIAPLERVHLCDTVGVVFEKYGINTRAEVIKTEWDCLAERYLSIELGDARSNFAKTLVDMSDQTQQEIVEAKSELQKAIDIATEALTGVNGGCIKIVQDADGKPQELLIMDDDDAAQATVVWRYNVAGWGVSTNGINGPYQMAATINSTYGASINANYIVVGTMLANRIKGGTLKLGGDNNGDGVFEIYNGSDAKIITIDKDGIRYENGKFSVNAAGELTATNANISGTITGSTISGSTIVSEHGGIFDPDYSKVTVGNGNITIESNGYTGYIENINDPLLTNISGFGLVNGTVDAFNPDFSEVVTEQRAVILVAGSTSNGYEGDLSIYCGGLYVYDENNQQLRQGITGTYNGIEYLHGIAVGAS